jgi:hypothetical protein
MSSLETTFRAIVSQLSPVLSISITKFFSIDNQFFAMQITTLVTALLGLIFVIPYKTVVMKVARFLWLEKYAAKLFGDDFVLEHNVWYIPFYTLDTKIDNPDFRNFRTLYFRNYDPTSSASYHACGGVAGYYTSLRRDTKTETLFEDTKITIEYKHKNENTDTITLYNFKKKCSYFKIVIHSEDTTIYRRFVSQLSIQDKKSINITTIDYPITSKVEGGKEVVEKTITTNTKRTRVSKTRENLSLSKDVDTKLFSKIRYFLDNKEVYERRGVPYTCGFVLYGPPGTGKTSIIKTLATEYSLPIIIVNLNNVDTTTDLKKMFETISTITQNYSSAPYLLVFEDFDRSKFFNERVCMDTFYNLLDGVEEMTGRIAIITCNNHVDILNDRALCRPGRFDTILHITYATQSQIQRMLQVFYDDQTITFDTPDSERMNPITPAEIQDILFSNSTNVEAAKQEIVKFK